MRIADWVKYPVGHVTWGDGFKAELFPDGAWICTYRGAEIPGRAEEYAARYADWDSGPMLYYGQGILPHLAKITGGTFVFHQPPPGDPNDRY